MTVIPLVVLVPPVFLLPGTIFVFVQMVVVVGIWDCLWVHWRVVVQDYSKETSRENRIPPHAACTILAEPHLNESKSQNCPYDITDCKTDFSLGISQKRPHKIGLDSQGLAYDQKGQAQE